jgi:hypothetical protein
VKAELGRFPVENFINSQAILYLARLHTDNLNPLLKEAFEVKIGLTKHIKFINTRLSIKILEMKLHSHLSKVLGNVKKTPYFIKKLL